MVVYLRLNPYIKWQWIWNGSGLHFLIIFIKDHFTLCVMAGVSSGSGLSLIMIVDTTATVLDTRRTCVLAYASSTGSETTTNSSSDVSSCSCVCESTTCTSSWPKSTCCNNSPNSVSVISSMSDVFIHVIIYERIVN